MKKRLKLIFSFSLIFIFLLSFCSAEETVNQCEDTDGGNYKNIFGVVKNKPSDSYGYSDQCFLTTGAGSPVDSCSGADCTITEHFCTDEPNYYGYYLGSDSLSPCPSGCAYGVCAGAINEEENEDVENETSAETNTIESFKEPECEPEYFCAVEPATCPSSGLQTEYCSDFKCKTAGTVKEVSCTPETCSGCKSGEICLPYGFRTKVDSKKLYCDINSKLKEQKTTDAEGNWAECQNNFECASNLCTEEECVNIQAVVGEANKFRQIFFPVFCKIIHPLNEDEYNSCLYDYLGNI